MRWSGKAIFVLLAGGPDMSGRVPYPVAGADYLLR